jgi:hypothetical protein
MFSLRISFLSVSYLYLSWMNSFFKIAVSIVPSVVSKPLFIQYWMAVFKISRACFSSKKPSSKQISCRMTNSDRSRSRKARFLLLLTAFTQLLLSELLLLSLFLLILKDLDEGVYTMYLVDIVSPFLSKAELHYSEY